MESRAVECTKAYPRSKTPPITADKRNNLLISIRQVAKDHIIPLLAIASTVLRSNTWARDDTARLLLLIGGQIHEGLTLVLLNRPAGSCLTFCLGQSYRAKLVDGKLRRRARSSHLLFALMCIFTVME